MNWKPSLGAWGDNGRVHFRVWAPEAGKIEVVRETSGAREFTLPLDRTADGFFEASSEEFRPGDLYRYRVDGQGPYPDPASRRQPQGVHGPSQVVDAAAFLWTDARWRGIKLQELILYEMHVGTFTPAGTFAAAAEKLPVLQDLGVTAVELMPLADFPGERNWGYDGVALFAPARCYGTPDDLRRFVDEAHRIGLAVHLDVVYNHFGPDGAYQGIFSPFDFSRTHKSPWGAAVNFDGPQSAGVRKFFIDNALHWIHEYHLDGLRLDATHAIVDTSPRHFLAELSGAVRESLRDGREGRDEGDSERPVQVIAEDVRNLAWMVKPESESGWGLDGVWSDDFHHEIRRFLAGDSDGYFEDFAGSAEEIAATARHGWFYSGQYAPFFGEERGSDPSGLSPQRFVFFLQNHDQVGNRAFGERLNHQIDLAAYRAATALLLLLPETPLLFMGQEWAASSPFQFFTDHHAELGKLVTEGRRNEFSRFRAFADPETRRRIPDPQDPETFERSRLNWEERESEPHASMIRYYRRLLALRRSEPALVKGEDFDIWDLDTDTLLLRRREASGGDLLAVIRLRGAGPVDLRGIPYAHIGLGRRWTLLLTSEEKPFAADGMPPRIDASGPTVEFVRPGAAVFKLELSGPGREK